jgi:hypothetical protein
MLRRLCIDYTVYTGNGAWHGAPETSVAIELDGVPWRTVLLAARLIKAMNAQQVVLIQVIPAQSMLV